MVKLNKIYTRTGDGGTTGLVTGKRRLKSDLRIEAYGTVDETNSVIGMARVHLGELHADVDKMLGHMQNDLFDLGADLATPVDELPSGHAPLRITASQTARVEAEIDALNERLQALTSGNAKALALLTQISPAAWRHILLNGHYTFQSDGKMIDLDALVAGLELG